MSSPLSEPAPSDAGDAHRGAQSPLFAPPSTATTPTAATADLYADHDSNYDMLDDDDNDPPAAGPGPSTLANRGHKRTASPPPQQPTAKKHKARQSVSTTTSSGRYDPPPLPHYTVVRAAHNSKQSPHRIIINHGVSDAHPDRWPPEEEYSPSRKFDGKENWYERTPKDTGRHKAFRDKVGDELAKTLKLTQRELGDYASVPVLPPELTLTPRPQARTNSGLSTPCRTTTSSPSITPWAAANPEPTSTSGVSLSSLLAPAYKSLR
jgi:hypothetical protein